MPVLGESWQKIRFQPTKYDIRSKNICLEKIELNMAKILLVNCYADDNKGDLGIILATSDVLTRIFQQSFGNQQLSISILSVFGSNEMKRNKYYRFLHSEIKGIIPSTFCVDSDHKSKLSRFMKPLQFGWGIARVSIALLLKKFMSINVLADLRLISNSDIVISKGGSFLYDSGSINSIFFFTRMISPLAIAQALGKRTVIFGQSIGPFKSSYSRWLASRIFNKCDIIIVREKYSLDILKDIGVKKQILRIGPDVVFSLKGQEGIPIQSKKAADKRLVIGVTVREVTNDPKCQNAYENKICNVLNWLLINKNVTIKFIPQVIGPSRLEDDRIVQKRIFDTLSALEENADKVDLVTDDLSVRGLLEQYRGVDLMLANRLHSSIFAAVLGIPSIVLEYQQHKAAGTYELLGIDDCVLQWDANEEDIIDSLNKYIKNLESYKSRIASGVDRANAQIEKMTEEIVKLIC